jgi:arylsulfatase A-like enzyme
MSQPHILFVLTDQMRPDELGPATPNLNRLASRGARFPNAYCASPLCQPARNCIVTGKFPTQHGVCGNMNDPISREERQDTYPQHLQEAGYHTACIGKHHYYDRYNLGVDVVEDDEAIKGYGYDHVWQVVDIFESRHNADRYTRWLEREGRLTEYREHLGQAYFEGMAPEETVDGYIGETALDYIQEYEEPKPLFLTVGFVGPHPPHWAPGQYSDMFDPEDMPAPKGVEDPARVRNVQRQRAKYRGQVAMIDDYVGRLVEVLEENGMRENTLIVVTSDHGHTIGDYGTHDKRFFWEQSVRVPLVMAGAGLPVDERAPANVRKPLVSGVDLYPTFLDAAGCGKIHGHGRRTGKSILRVLSGEEPAHRQVISELGTTTMVRDANWKMVYDPEQDGVQWLYNLRRDPEELDNLAGVPEYRGVEADLAQKLLDHMARLTRETHTKEESRLQRVRIV